MDHPSVTIEQVLANSYLSSKTEENINEDDKEEEEDDSEEDEEVEEEEVETEMTQEEKKAMYEAVKTGDIDALEDCLDRPNADINMIWYKENLLMVAIRHEHEEVAEFLLDNGVDHTYSTSVMELRERPRGIILDRYDLTCRQMAYDRGLLDLVQLIDFLQGNIFPFVHPPDRKPRHRRAKPSSLSELEDCSSGRSDGDDVSTNESEIDNDGSDNSSTRSKKKKRTKITNGDKESWVDVDEKEEEKVVFNYDDKDSVKKKRKQKMKAGDRNMKDEIQNTFSEEVTSRIDGNIGRHIVDNIKLLMPSALTEPVKLLNIRPSKAGTSSSQEKFTKRSMNDTVLIRKSVVNRKLSPNAGFFETTTEKSSATITMPELEHSRLMQPRNRIWSSKSALAMRRANRYRHLLNDHHLTSPQTRPLKWRKISTVGSYTAESKLWHAETTCDAGFFVEVTEEELAPVPPAPLTMMESCKHQSSVLQCNQKIALPSDTKASSNRKDPTSKCSKSTTDTTIKTVKVPAYEATYKRRLSPRFRNSYEVLDFIPGIRSDKARLPIIGFQEFPNMSSKTNPMSSLTKLPSNMTRNKIATITSS